MSVQKRRRSFAFLNRDASSISFSFSDLSDFRTELMPALHKQLSCLAGQKIFNLFIINCLRIFLEVLAQRLLFHSRRMEYRVYN